jgi:hypothetical protein
MEYTEAAEDRKHQLAHAVQSAHLLHARAQALMNRATHRIYESIHLVRQGQTMLRHSPPRPLSPHSSSPPNRS